MAISGGVAAFDLMMELDIVFTMKRAPLRFRHLLR
jgi:hypothetical protein